MTAPPADAARTLRAAADVFVPGPPEDPTPGAAAIEADRFLAHYLDSLMPGLAEGLPVLLDELAAARAPGRGFADLARGDREAIIESLETHEVAQLRQLPQLLAVLSIAAYYGEWTGQDADGAVVRTPIGWQAARARGPIRGRPDLLREPPA